MRSNLFGRAALAAALTAPFAFAFAMAAPASASACENGVEIEVDYNTPRIARAEKALNEGKYTLAAVGVLQVFPSIKSTAVTSSPLAGRAAKIIALAAVRTGGELTAGKHFRGGTPEDSAANLRWAVDTLRALNKLYKNKPALETDLGEALSMVAEHKDEALAILSRLASKDLITSAHGFAALARLRDAAGDKGGSEEAARRCEAIAKKPGICRAGSAPSA